MGVAITPNGKVYIIVQSIMEMPDVSLPAGGGTAKTSKKRLLCALWNMTQKPSKRANLPYPIDTAMYDKAKDAKIGDLVAINDTQFALIEQGRLQSRWQGA